MALYGRSVKKKGAWGAGVILPPCAQLLWCELYIIKDAKKKKKKKPPDDPSRVPSGLTRGYLTHKTPQKN